MLALFPKCAVSQEEVQGHKADTVCRNRTLSLTHCHQGSGTRHPRRKEVLDYPGKHREQNPCLLFLRVAYCCPRDLKGRSQKCSAHAKVCVSALSFKQVLLESQIGLPVCLFSKSRWAIWICWPLPPGRECWVGAVGKEYTLLKY